MQKNPIIAAKQYRQAIERGYAGGQEDLNRLYENSDISAHDLNEIGIMYYKGEGVAQNLERAMTWFKKASKKGSGTATRNLGFCYEYGYFVEKDFVEAASYYRRAVEKGYAEAETDLERLYQTLPAKMSRSSLKTFERERIVWDAKRRPDNFLAIVDSSNNSPLHRAAKTVRLKDCARLLFMGGSIESYNRDNELPLAGLNQSQRIKLRRLQNTLADLISRMDEKPPEILAGRISVKGGIFNREDILPALNNLYRQNEIKPLMDLAKLAALGLHELSERRCFAEGYDSDDDDDITKNPNSDLQKLDIQIDASKTTVEGMCYWGEDGRKGTGALGVYFPGGNTVYVGGRNSNGNARTPAEIRATLIHELTHFLAYEIFKNKGNPYLDSDVKNKNLFTEIAAELQQHQDGLDPILRQVFLLYSADQHHAELIVRVPQMIVEYASVEGNNGLRRLENQAPRLLAYYNNVFIREVESHINKLEQRALRNWPKELFNHDRTEVYGLQRLTM